MPLHGISAVPACPGVAGTNALGRSKLEDSEDARPAASDEQEEDGGQAWTDRIRSLGPLVSPFTSPPSLHYDLFSYAFLEYLHSVK